MAHLVSASIDTPRPPKAAKHAQVVSMLSRDEGASAPQINLGASNQKHYRAVVTPIIDLPTAAGGIRASYAQSHREWWCHRRRHWSASLGAKILDEVAGVAQF